MEEEDTLREMANLDLDYQPLCIATPDEEAMFELKFGLIHLLPSFQGLPGEDPNKHQKEIHVVCSSMKLVGIPVEQVKQAGTFSL